jgi:hypothetical protein
VTRSAGAGKDPYEALLAHVELELELAGRGDLDGLAALAPRWRELAESVASTPSSAGGETLARARLIHERTHVELLRNREGVLRELADVRRSRSAARAYGRPAGHGAVQRSA